MEKVQGHDAAELNNIKIEELRYCGSSTDFLCLLLMTPTSVFSQVTQGEEAGDNEHTARKAERLMTYFGEVKE